MVTLSVAPGRLEAEASLIWFRQRMRGRAEDAGFGPVPGAGRSAHDCRVKP